MNLETFNDRVDKYGKRVASLDDEIEKLKKLWGDIEADAAKGTVSGEAVRMIGLSLTTITAEAGIDLEKTSLETLLETKMVKDWLQTIRQEKRFSVEKILIQSVDMFGPKVGFVKLNATVRIEGKQVPGIVFMRGGSVGVLVVLRHSDSNGKESLSTLVVRQPRVPVACGDIVEIPAGMLDGDGNFAGVAAKELKEETGLEINVSELVDMTELVFRDSYPGMYPTCGGSDEFNRLYVHQKDVTAEEVESMNGRLTGVAEEGERIKVQILPLDQLWRQTADAKALAALCLYNKLSAQGKISFPKL